MSAELSEDVPGDGVVWRFEARTTALVEPGSLRVLAGEALQVGADTLVLRLQGKAGERVSFSFRSR